MNTQTRHFSRPSTFLAFNHPHQPLESSLFLESRFNPTSSNSRHQPNYLKLTAPHPSAIPQLLRAASLLLESRPKCFQLPYQNVTNRGHLHPVTIAGSVNSQCRSDFPPLLSWLNALDRYPNICCWAFPALSSQQRQILRWTLLAELSFKLSINQHTHPSRFYCSC